MQTNTSGGPSADVKQESMKTFHSWLGRIGGLIVPESVRLWGPPVRGSWAIMAIEIPDGLQFFNIIPAFTDVCGKHIISIAVQIHLCTQRDTRPLFCLHALRIFLPAQFFKSLTCILLSFTLPPPLPVFPPTPSPPAVSVTCSQTSGLYIAMT